ncbi:MAG TPA: GNAT family N-acetyltransferase [Myxococcota bacterium]|jgi:GNAT superfamily N-acetyltransferase|nr:GNAT family N-acetyltransferase [Myxococcota bacterium]
MSEPFRIAEVPEAHDREAAEILARAFRDNPLHVAVLGGDPVLRLRANRRSMAELVPIARRAGMAIEARRGACGAGVLLAAPPHGYPLPPPPLPALLRAWLLQGPRVRSRWLRVFHHLDALHPRTPHWYVAALGVDPPLQRQGFGRALIRALCARASADGVFAYLETDRPENAVFYESEGFAVVGQSTCLGVRLWHMRTGLPL